MTRTLRPGALAAALLAAACGGPDDRATCTTSADCPTGQYCAATAPRTCWADAAPPAVTGVTVRCSTAPCRRDATLTVEATAGDGGELAGVTAALDLDGGARRVAMASAGGALFRASLPLLDWPFPADERPVEVLVRAVDGAGNVRAVAAATRPVVTRRVAEVELSTQDVIIPTAPALLPDGRLLVGGSTGRLYSYDPDASGPVVLGVALGAPVGQPPVVGQQAIWVVAGNKLFAVAPDGASVLNGTGYDTGGAIPAPPAVTAAAPTASAPEVAFVGSAGGRMAAVKAEATANGLIDFIGGIGPFSAGPTLASDSEILAVTSTTAPLATWRAFSFGDGLREGSTRPIGQLVTAPLALAADGGAWTASSELSASTLQRTLPDGTPGASIPLGANPGGGPVVLADGSVAISVGATLRRHAAGGAAVWAAPAALTGDGLTPLVLAAPGGERTLLVPTRAGTVDAVRAQDGARLWSASLTVNVELREGTVAPSADGRSSVAWFTSADGRLHGLVVDGALDAAAPWPKAWHDRRNTGHLAAPR